MNDLHRHALRCPKCGKAIEAVGNAFFGVGLSTHRYVRVCSDCNWTEFVRGPITEPIQVQLELPGRWTRLIHSFFHIHRRFGQES